MLNRLYTYRFEIFLVIQLAILFGSLVFPNEFYDRILLPTLFLASIAAGILLISSRRKLTWLFTGLFVIAIIVFGSESLIRSNETESLLIRLPVYFVFYIVVTWNIIQQVWQAQRVTKNVIMGLMSGYISLGFLASFLFMMIDLTHSGAFTGSLTESSDLAFRTDGILYYAFITLMTIGYGDIVPSLPISRKAAILVGLMGQFYLVIITAVVVEKYIRHSVRE